MTAAPAPPGDGSQDDRDDAEAAAVDRALAALGYNPPEGATLEQKRELLRKLQAAPKPEPDLDDDPEQPPDGPPLPPLAGLELVETYRYIDEAGSLAFVVGRYRDSNGEPESKTFRQARLAGGRWVWNLDGTRRVPYRLPQVHAHLAANDEHAPLYIVDGEKDVHAIEAAGAVATCSPGGMGNWTPELVETLAGARSVVVVADRDDGQGIKQAGKLVELLAQVGVTADVVEAAEGKDAHDHLAAGHTRDEFKPCGPPTDDTTSAHTWLPVDLIGAELAPPEPPTIGGIVYPGRRHVFSGEPESLKSWSLLALCLEEMLAGHAAVYVDFEMGRRETLERFRALGASDELLAERLVYLEPSEPMTGPAILADVRALLKTRRPSLVVIDAFSGALALHGLDENSNSDVERFYRTVVDELRAEGAAVVILDHLTKDKEARGKYSIGAGRKIGAADVHLRFEVIQPFGRGKTGKAKLETQKDRPGHLARPKAAELELVSHPSGTIEWTLTIADDQPRSTFRPTVLMEKVSIYIERCVDPPSGNIVDNGVKGNTDARRLALKLLVDEGFVGAEEGPRKATLLRSIKPYRQAADPASPSTSPTSPNLALTSPTGEDDDFAHLAHTPVGGGALGEVEVDEDELERLENLSRELGLDRESGAAVTAATPRAPARAPGAEA